MLKLVTSVSESPRNRQIDLHEEVASSWMRQDWNYVLSGTIMWIRNRSYGDHQDPLTVHPSARIADSDRDLLIAEAGRQLERHYKRQDLGAALSAFVAQMNRKMRKALK